MTRPVALVTGASSGIGRAIALELARRDHDLVVTARRTALLDDLAAAARSRHGASVEVVAADLASAAGRAEVAGRLAAGVDVLVANAGFSTRGFFPALPLERELAEIGLNVEATVALCHAAAAAMVARRRGRILVTSSAASFQPLPGLATYGATKAFLTAFALALDAELRPRGVTVSCLAPGFTLTEKTREAPRPAWLWSTAEGVARAGVAGLLSGRSLIVPGAPWRAAAILAPRVPRRVTAAIALRMGRRLAGDT